MTTMFLVAGAILGLLLFLMIRRSFKKAEKRGELGSRPLECPSCHKLFKAEEAWVRTGLRGAFFKCTHCGTTSIWDTDVKPPKLAHKIGLTP